MTSKETSINKFKRYMDTFLDKLAEWCNHDQQKQLFTLRTLYSLGMKSDPHSSIQMFLDNVRSHIHAIMRKDDRYFMTQDININTDMDGIDSSFLNTVRQWWTEFTPDQQQYIKDRIALITMLGVLAGKDQELLKVINSYRRDGSKLSF